MELFVAVGRSKRACFWRTSATKWSMSRDDHLLDRPDPNDVRLYDSLVSKAFQAKRKIETGFLELAESLFEIHRNKLYKLHYKRFEDFCDVELGFSRQTVYVFLSILRLARAYPKWLPQQKVVELGHKKMRYITEGVSAIEKADDPDKVKEDKKIEIFKTVSPKMASAEIQTKVQKIVEK